MTGEPKREEDPMSAEEGKGGFWRTIPGMLTAVAGTISAVTGLVIALSQAGVMSPRGAEEPEEGPPIEGVWSAQVTYPWNDSYAESFDFRVEEGRIRGTASYLGVPRAIEEGSVSGDRVTFLTRAAEMMGEETRSYENHYDGKIAARGIQFSLQDTRGEGPIEFTAVKKRD
jgi:hypothetical protein